MFYFTCDRSLSYQLQCCNEFNDGSTYRRESRDPLFVGGLLSYYILAGHFIEGYTQHGLRH